MSERGDPVRHLPHVAPPIIPATDLGGVAVLKRGAVTLLWTRRPASDLRNTVEACAFR